MASVERARVNPLGDEEKHERPPLRRSGSPTFFGAPQHLDLTALQAAIAFLGVPFDGATNDRPGSRFGPLAIRDASMRFRDGIGPGWVDMESGQRFLRGAKMADCGDVYVRTLGLEKTYDMIEAAVRELRQTGAFPVIVGGDHSITYPVLRAYDGDKIVILHFDAHLDFTDEWVGVRWSHDNPLRRAVELPQVAGLVQIGIRGLERPAVYEDALRHRSRIVCANELIRTGAHEALKDIPPADGYYVTLDIDVLDPAVAPGTGYPEAGGLSYRQLKEALGVAAGKGRIVGFDLVEVNPQYDHAGVTSRLAARLILDFLGAVDLKR